MPRRRGRDLSKDDFESCCLSGAFDTASLAGIFIGSAPSLLLILLAAFIVWLSPWLAGRLPGFIFR